MWISICMQGINDKSDDINHLISLSYHLLNNASSYLRDKL
jgi:hypothetical protein